MLSTLFRAAKVKTSYQLHNSNLNLFLIDECCLIYVTFALEMRAFRALFCNL